MSKSAGSLRYVLAWSALTIAALGATAQAKEKALSSQFLEPPMIYEVRFGYIPESTVSESDSGADLGSTDFIETDADWAFAYYRGANFDIDLNLRLRSTIFHDSADGRLPGQVAQAAIDAGWIWRGKSTAFQARLAPGMYSDLEDFSLDALAMPFSLSLIRSFSPELSGMAGVQIRPGFDRSFIPLVGIIWDPNDSLRIDLRCPSSKIRVFMPNGWSTHFGLDWENTSYDMDDSRDQLTMDYYRAYVGVAGRITSQAQITFDIGSIFHRTIEFDDEDVPGGAELDVEKAFFARVGVGAPF